MSDYLADSELDPDADALRDLMLRVSSLHRRHLMDILAEYDLTTPQYHALLIIARQPGGCTMSALAEGTYQVGATVTGIVRRLVEHDVVDQRPDPDDGRSRRVFLTDAGAALMAAVDARRQEHSRRILQAFGPADRRELLRLMTHYLQATEQAEPQTS